MNRDPVYLLVFKAKFPSFLALCVRNSYIRGSRRYKINNISTSFTNRKVSILIFFEDGIPYEKDTRRSSPLSAPTSFLNTPKQRKTEKYLLRGNEGTKERGCLKSERTFVREATTTSAIIHFNWAVHYAASP